MIDVNDLDQLANFTGTEEIIKPLISDENNYIQNQDILAELEAEESRLNMAFGIGSFLTAAPGVIPVASWLAIPGMVAVGFSAEYLTRVRRLYSVTKMLLDYFGDEGIKITLRVNTDSAIIDLFVRMPDKRKFALMVRTSKNTSVKWSEERQEFFILRKGKSAKKCDSLTRTIGELETLSDLRKRKSPLMGTSSNERNATTMKTIVLGQGAEIAASNSPELWTEFGQTRALKIRTTSVTYVVRQDDLIKFMLPPEKELGNVN